MTSAVEQTYIDLESQLQTSPRELLQRLDSRIEGFKPRLTRRLLSRTELIKACSVVEVYGKSDYVNVRIALRLLGGVVGSSKLLGYNNEFELIDALANDYFYLEIIESIKKTEILASDFFKSKRTYYSNHEISLFRQRNLNQYLSLLSGEEYSATIDSMTTALAGDDFQLSNLMSATQTHLSDVSTRHIESELKLPRGFFDQSQLNLEVF